ncbi:hypothetical protein IFU25_00500 [Pantoea agglomerans]|uniref:hypothetical protein n=1 Tax=Enterobacter agglomerans TaxID=549 RepID=UPI0017813171|nr:hypothetical protein [Pantoea agglomerans]MBD8180172.1 hypothetical protein [Pantoea agglomerans]
MDVESGDHFLDIDDDMLNFLEKHGEETVREIHLSNLANKESGQKLLSLLIVGIGSSFLLLTQNRPEKFLTAGLGVFTLYWSLCAAYLIVRVLNVRQRALATSPPGALYHAGYKNFNQGDYERFREKGFKAEPTELNIMRRYRLFELEEIARDYLRENLRVGLALERVRIATILTPICAFIISTLTYLFL